jgi:hypothetical protein
MPAIIHYFRLKSGSQNARYHRVRFPASEVHRAGRDDWGTIKSELSRYFDVP